ncbi:MAG TPA: hypothetical protein PLC98_08030 [Anaerolineales bacterium]|nr:hypothetical protein [Anaerolineales bacterium]
MSRTEKRSESGGAKLSPADALDVLASALNYCKDAGLHYWLANGTQGEGLLIRLPGALVSEDGSRLMEVEAPGQG